MTSAVLDRFVPADGWPSRDELCLMVCGPLSWYMAIAPDRKSDSSLPLIDYTEKKPAGQATLISKTAAIHGR